MADEWFYTRDGTTRSGPVSTTEIQSMAKAGQLLPTDMVWKEGMPNWAPASSVKTLFAAPPSNVKPAVEEGPRNRARLEEEPLSVLPAGTALPAALVLGILKWVALGLGGLFAFIAIFLENFHAVGLSGFAIVLALAAQILQAEEHRTKK
jgi:hypothetical protein